jgi:processive 1,2-diacylglycerol beta-glucosyltransferase
MYRESFNVPKGGLFFVGDLRVLVFSATFGAGHVRAAEAIIEVIRAKEPKAEITHLDFGAFLSKSINEMVKSTYIELIKYTPRLWGKFYYRTSKIQPDSVLKRLINILGRREFLNYIKDVRPDVIICTYPTIAGVLGELRLKSILQVPIVTVVTDYAVHSHWIHPGVDLYIVGNRDVFQGLTSSGIDPERIRITGIPVSPKFEQKLNRKEIAENLKLFTNRPTFLVMGGAYGVLGGVKGVCKILADAEVPVQTLLVCGQDEKLYRSLDGLVAEAKNPIMRFGYVKNVEELMTVADMIITKAGGLTVSEALTKRLPLIIYKPIPGQEEGNAHFVKEIGAAKIAETEEDLEKIIHLILTQPNEINKMREAAGKVLPGNASERAVEYILLLVGAFRKKIDNTSIS